MYSSQCPLNRHSVAELRLLIRNESWLDLALDDEDDMVDDDEGEAVATFYIYIY